MCVYLNELFHLTHTTNGTGLKIDLLSAVSAVFFVRNSEISIRSTMLSHNAQPTHSLYVFIKVNATKKPPSKIPTHIGYLFKKNIVYGVCVCVGHSKGN